MIWRRGPDDWGAFGLTCILMMLWVWTPLGTWEMTFLQWVGALFTPTPVGDLGPALALWAWPATGLPFFFAARIVLRRRRLRREAEAASVVSGDAAESPELD